MLIDILVIVDSVSKVEWCGLCAKEGPTKTGKKDYLREPLLISSI